MWVKRCGFCVSVFCQLFRSISCVVDVGKKTISVTFLPKIIIYEDRHVSSVAVWCSWFVVAVHTMVQKMDPVHLQITLTNMILYCWRRESTRMSSLQISYSLARFDINRMPAEIISVHCHPYNGRFAYTLYMQLVISVSCCLVYMASFFLAKNIILP